MGVSKLVSITYCISEEEAGFTNTTVANKQELKEVVTIQRGKVKARS
jgi:hypothetical protein